MPHVSRKNVDHATKQRLNAHIVSLLSDTAAQTRRDVLKELLTETERIMLMKRLGTILLISHGISSYKIEQALGVSSSTVARYELAVEQGRCARTLVWLKQQRIHNRVLKLLVDLASIPFKAQHRSFARWMDQNSTRG